MLRTHKQNTTTTQSLRTENGEHNEITRRLLGLGVEPISQGVNVYHQHTAPRTDVNPPPHLALWARVSRPLHLKQTCVTHYVGLYYGARIISAKPNVGQTL